MDYPKHCIECWNRERCQQKQYMLAGTESVPGYVGCADVWCKEHAPKESESAGYYPESDAPMHCVECGRPLQYSLTDYGVSYVKDVIENNAGCCQELWPILFIDYLGD